MNLSATSVVSLDDSSTVSANAVGNGGDVSINTLRLELDHDYSSRISANGGRNGGKLNLSADERTNLNFTGPDTDATAKGGLGANGSTR